MQLFAHMSWQDARMMALSQAGLVEKFVDALVWMIWPLYLAQHGLALSQIGWVLGSYGITWGVAQLATGYFSDVVGRHRLNWMGMWVCALGVALFPVGSNAGQWSACAALSGLGMAMLYPNLSAAVADLAAPAWRASAIGIYRFWRDLGYAIGAVGIGLSASIDANLDNSFWFVSISMCLSGSLLAWLGHNDLRSLDDKTL
jgi:MFS family permease